MFDTFNRSTKDLPGGYCLELDREFTQYRLQSCWGRRKVDVGVGVLEGTLDSIGWNEKAIVAWRSSCCGEGDGYMIVDVSTDEVEGPLSPEQLEDRFKSDSRLTGITVQPVARVLK